MSFPFVMDNLIMSLAIEPYAAKCLTSRANFNAFASLTLYLANHALRDSKLVLTGPTDPTSSQRLDCFLSCLWFVCSALLKKYQQSRYPNDCD